MRTFDDSERIDENSAEDQEPDESETLETPSSNYRLYKAAHDWDNALQIAADRMWGDPDLLYRIVRRK